MSPRVKITVPARTDHKGKDSIEIEVRWFCPECGGQRGEIYDAVSISMDKNGRFGKPLDCHGWNNPCGHIDDYPSLIEEAERSKVEDINDEYKDVFGEYPGVSRLFLMKKINESY